MTPSPFTRGPRRDAWAGTRVRDKPLDTLAL